MQTFQIQKSFEIDDYNDVEDIQKGFYGSISGILSVAEVCDRQGDIIEINALQKALQRAKDRKANIPFLFEHQSDQMIGNCEICKTGSIENNNLRITAYFDKSDLAQEKREEVKKGMYKSLSIGGDAVFKSSKYVNGKNIRTISDIKVIKEASLVKTPANQYAHIDLVKSHNTIGCFDEIGSKQEWKNVLSENIFKSVSDENLNNLWNVIHKTQDENIIRNIIKFAGYDISSEIIEDMYKSAHNIIQKNIVATQATEQEATQAEAKPDYTSLVESSNKIMSMFNNKL